MKTVVGILTFFSFLSFTKFCYAHGVGYKMFNGGVGIEFFYEDVKQTPMSYCEVKIFSPEDKNTEFQRGITDKNGRFVFYPDTKGKWKIEIHDGRGHGLVKEIEISEDLDLNKTASSHIVYWQKILIGISIIFLFTGALFYRAAKKKTGT